MFISGLYPEAIGGVEVLGEEVARRLAERHEVVVYTSHAAGRPAREERDGYLIRRIRSTYDFRLKIPLGVRTLSTLQVLRKEREKPDILLSMSLGPGLITHLGSKLLGVPYVAYVLGSDWYIARDSPVKGFPFRTLLKGCAVAITQTGIIKADILRRFPDRRIEVIPNGITIPEKRASGDKIVFLGRLHPVKGVEYLVEAARRIENCPEVLIAGDGPEADALKRKAAGAPVRFLGRIDSIEELMMQGMIFVLPSLSEGLPQAMLEAMSYGLPVVATRVGGVPEVVEHGTTGFLVQPGNAEELARHIELLVRDDALRARMSDSCITASRAYSWEYTMEKIERVLESVA